MRKPISRRRYNAMMIIALVALLVAAFFSYIRLTVLPMEQAHIDPRLAQPGSKPNFVLLTGGDAARVSFESREALRDALRKVLKALPRTVILHVDETGFFMTSLTRSGVLGFPDYTSFVIEEGGDDDGIRLHIYARSRFGYSDFGVNQARVKRVLSQLADLADAKV